MIGFFDSGIGGLTVLESVHSLLPQYDTVYLGDTARSPYGSRTHDELVTFTIEGATWLFDKGCSLIIVACNSASASALREVQQEWLQANHPDKRILGIIRPTVEKLATLGYTKIGVFGTAATIKSGAYVNEFHKINPQLQISSHSCPSWAPMIEKGLAGTEEMKIEVQKEVALFEKDNDYCEAILLACTHFPYVKDDVENSLSKKVPVFNQGEIIAASLEEYLARHQEIDSLLSKQSRRSYFVTENPDLASEIALKRFGFKVTFLTT